MKRDEKNYRIGDGSIHPSLRNLRFQKYGYSLIDKSVAVLILIVILNAVIQNQFECKFINFNYDANKDGLINYKDIGFFVNQAYHQPLLWLQKIPQTGVLFTFLNIGKNICLSFESIIFSSIIWLGSSFLIIKIFLLVKYIFKLSVHSILFDLLRINPFSTINKPIFQLFYPVKNFRFNSIFILVLFLGLALVQFKLMMTIDPAVHNVKKDPSNKESSTKKNKQSELVHGGRNYTNIYINNIHDLKKLDARVASITSQDAKNLYTLSKALTDGLSTELEKTYVIYKWITSNISYDVDAFLSNNLRGIGKASTVLERRKAICDGYAELFMRLAIQSGLLVDKVEGYAKGYGYKIGENMAIPNHAWNAVRIDGNLYLLDATWDSGFLNERAKKFEKKITEFDFFLTNPQIFIYSHYPKDEKFKLTNHIGDKKEFFSTVNVKESAFKIGLNIDKNRNAIVKTDYLPYILDFESNTVLRGGLTSGDENVPGQWTLQKFDANGNSKLLVSSPRNGDFKLQLYSAIQKNATNLHGIIEYKFIVNNSSNNFHSFPLTYGMYNAKKVILEYPLNGVLSSIQSTKFKIKANQTSKLVIYQNQKIIETMVPNEDGYFIADIKLDKGEVVISGEFDTPNTFEGILKYQVN